MDDIHEALARVQTLRDQWDVLWRTARAQACEETQALRDEAAALRVRLEDEQRQSAACRAELACVHRALAACLRQDDEVAALRQQVARLRAHRDTLAEQLRQRGRAVLALAVVQETREAGHVRALEAAREQVDGLARQTHESQQRAAALELGVQRGVAERQVDATRARTERVALETRLAEMAAQHRDELARMQREHEAQQARSRAALEGELAASDGLRAEVRELRAALVAANKRGRTDADTPDAIDETTPTSSQKRRAAARAAEAAPLAEKFPFLTQVCPVPRRSTKSKKRKCNSGSTDGSNTTNTLTATATMVPCPLDFCQVPEF